MSSAEPGNAGEIRSMRQVRSGLCPARPQSFDFLFNSLAATAIEGSIPREWAAQHLGWPEHEPIEQAMPLAALLMALDAAPLLPVIEKIENWRELQALAAELLNGEADYAGMLAEMLLPLRLRHKQGMHITAPLLADFVLALASDRKPASLLDPACGGGMFLLREGQVWDSERITKSAVAKPALTGIDSSPLAIRLACRNLAGSSAQLIESDFFQVAPTLGQYAAIAGNLPYVRQEFIPAKADLRNAIAALYSAHGQPSPALPARADLHVYFWAALLPLLLPGYRASLITSASWLDVDYGSALRALLLEQAELRMVIESAAETWFGEASVRAAITVVERKPCNPAPARFVTLKLPLAELAERYGGVSALAGQLAVAAERDDAEMRIRQIEQNALTSAPATPWGIYRRAPRLYFDLLQRSEDMRPLGELAQASFGLKTGANNFFYLSNEEAAARGIPARHLRPVVKSLRDFESLELNPATLRWRVLMVAEDEYALTAAGEQRLLAYLREGATYNYTAAQDARKAGIPALRPTCRIRRHWYTLRPQTPAPLIMSMIYGDRYLVGLNASDAQVDAALYRLVPYHMDQLAGLAAILNSGWGRLAYEINAFILVGKLDVAQMKLSQVKRLPLLDPARLPPHTWQMLLEPLLKRPILHTVYELAQPDRQELDDAFLAACGYRGAGERGRIHRDLYNAVLDLVLARMGDEMM